LNGNGWFGRTNPRDWTTRCDVPNCTRVQFPCPVCHKLCHRHLWVDLHRIDQIVVIAKHSHFIRRGLRDEARNWNHKIRNQKVDPRSFAVSRRISNVNYLPQDVRRIFGER
jgi:hypothetical protein